MQPIPLLHWDVGETDTQVVYGEPVYKCTRGHIFHSEPEASPAFPQRHGSHLGPVLRSVIPRQPGL